MAVILDFEKAERFIRGPDAVITRQRRLKARFGDGHKNLPHPDVPKEAA